MIGVETPLLDGLLIRSGLEAVIIPVVPVLVV